jgi:hypothetical protein
MWFEKKFGLGKLGDGVDMAAGSEGLSYLLLKGLCTGHSGH